MVSELADPEIVTLEEFRVAGLAHRGPPGEEFDDIWLEFTERVDGLTSITTGDESYGVVYEYANGAEFTYVAGASVEDASDLAPELTVVEIPAGPYAVFETSASEMTALMDKLSGTWSLDGEYERVMGPIFERYGEAYDSVNRDGTFEFYVPVERTATI